MNHKDVLALLPGYALGALEQHESEAVSDHIQTCDSCFAAAQEHLEVSASLSTAIVDADPPDGLRARVQASIARVVASSRPAEAPSVEAPRRPFLVGWPAFTLAGAAAVSVVLLVVVLVLALVSQGDLSDLKGENASLAAKVDSQTAASAASQDNLTRLRDDNQSLGARLDDQGETLVTSQKNLSDLSASALALTSKIDSLSAALAASQEALANLRQDTESLATTLEGQGSVLGTSQTGLDLLSGVAQALTAKIDTQSAALETSRKNLAELRTTSQSLASTAAANKDDLTELRTTSQSLASTAAANKDDLTELRRTSLALTAQLDDQSDSFATSQADIDELQEQSLALGATVTNQQIFSYLQALPVTNKYVLKATADAPGTFGLLMTNVADSWGVAIVLGLDPLEPGTVYQLWLEKDGVATHGWFIKKVDPVSKFGQVYAQQFPTPVDQFDRIFITLEPLGGSPAPTGPALLSATIN